MSGADPFGTAKLRRQVLDAWTASPARFREDANAEEDVALGGYRDRVIVELAQNAADAATRGGAGGRLRFTLGADALIAANTGAPLDAAGVVALATLRASAKRGDGRLAGRFGVGFGAVVAISDEPMIVSAAGGVRWSRGETRALATEIPALAGELAARDGHVPVLRLPFALEERPDGFGGEFPGHTAGDDAGVVLPKGFDTAVVLPLRDAHAAELIRRLLGELGPALLLALPALVAIEVRVDTDSRTLTAERTDDDVVVITDRGTSTHWRLRTRTGQIGAELLADRPTEERARPVWSAAWALPIRGEKPDRLPAGTAPVLHAPTPTDEPIGLPALLIASFPIAPDRRHVAPGPLTDFLAAEAAAGYAELVAGIRGPALLDLIPGPIAAGELDAAIRRGAVARLADAPMLDAADDPDLRLTPREAVVLDIGGPVHGELVAVLAPVLPGLLSPRWPSRHAGLNALLVRRIGLGELIDALAEIRRDPTWWRRLYGALAGAGAGATDPEALAGLPVPLADDRLVRSPRGVVLLTGDGGDQARRARKGPQIDTTVLAPLGLRVAHPDAAHPLLARLGATEATPRSLLTDPATRAAVAGSYDADDPDPVARAVLALVVAAGLQPGDEPWLADLALPGADGESYPAGELLLPDGPLAGLVAADAPFGLVADGLLDSYGGEALEAVGVLRTFATLHEENVPLGPFGPDFDLDCVEGWADDVLAGLRRQRDAEDPGRVSVPPVAPTFTAVRDLELVASERWPQALRLLAAPPLRAAVMEPTVIVTADGRHVDVPSYSAWWLRTHPVCGGRRPAEARLEDSDPLLAGLYEDAPPAGDMADAEFLRAVGVRSSLAELLAEPGGPDDLLARLADSNRPVTRTQLRALWTALARLDRGHAHPPDRVRALLHGEITVAAAEDAVIVDAPDLLPFVAGRPLVLVPSHLATALADNLDLYLASEQATGKVESSGVPVPVPPAVRTLLSQAPEVYERHDRLVVDGRQVPWRHLAGVIHASGEAGLARGVAWAAGQWERRHAIEAVLRAPDQLGDLLAEADLDP